MVDVDILTRRLKKIEDSYKKLLKYQNLTLEQFLQDDIAQDLVEYNLFICINLMTDITNHLVTDLNLGEIDFLRDGFRLLSQHKYISQQEEEKFIKMVGFRNIIAHEYLIIDKKLVYSILKNHVKDIKMFMGIIVSKFL